jgi:hypothetical protein
MGLWVFLVSIGHFTLIKERSFGSETWLSMQNQKPGKGCVIEKLSSPSNKENGSIVISKEDCGKLSWGHKHVLVLDFLYLGLTLPADCYCGTLSFSQMASVTSHQIIVPLCENARCHTPNWTAVYGCTSHGLWISPNLCSVFCLSLHP